MNLREKLYRFNYIYAPYLHHTKPVDVSLELSSTCNQACSYCYFSDKANLPFKQSFMDKDLALMIVDQCDDLGVNSIKFNYRGESTLHPEFEYITWSAKRYAKKSTFIDRLTNSNFKFKTSNDSIFRGLSNQTKVKISFDSFDAEVMEFQRAGSNHKIALNNINKFYNFPERIKSETKIVIQAVRTLLNKDEDIADIAKKMWPEAEISIRDMVAGRVNKDLSELENRERDVSDRQTCIQAHARLIIGHDGIAQACCPDIGSKIVLGDANKETIHDIWTSKAAKELRKTLLNKKAFANEPCKSCSSFESYRGFKPTWKS